jgi:small subunit ribosomal protein S16
MLKIRLQRVGRKNDPSFRAVCVDSRRGPKAGKHTEVLGSYDPKRDYIAINGERVKHWISNGAKVSDTMHNLLVKKGIINSKKIHVAKEKKKTEEVKKEEKPKEEVKEKEKTAEVNEEVKAETEAPKEEVKEEAHVVEEKQEQEVAEEKKEVV